MLPIIIIAYRYGTGWGVFTGGVYGLFQMLLGMNNLRYGTSFWSVLCIILFDYILAFGVLGLGGIFRKTFRNQGLALAAGSLLVSVLRYACHFVSGWAVWGIWAPEGMPAWLYSLGYNASYMVPEAIITILGAVLISLFLDFSSTDITRRAKQSAPQTDRNNAAVAAKMVGLGTVIGGVLYNIFTAANVLFLNDPDAAVPKDSMLKVLAVTAIAGVVLYALGEVVQLLSDLRAQKAAKGTKDSGDE